MVRWFGCFARRFFVSDHCMVVMNEVAVVMDVLGVVMVVGNEVADCMRR